MSIPSGIIVAMSDNHPPRLSREASRLQTRERLLDAAAEVFKRHGYAKASLDAVAEAAGYTKGAVYSNFRTKADLFTALIDRVIEAESARQAQELAEVPLEEFIGSLDRLFERQVNEDPVWAVLQFEFWLAAMRDPEIRTRVLASTERARRYAAGMIERSLADSGRTAPFTPAELALLVNALATGLGIQYQLDPGSIDMSLIVRAARRLFGLDHWTPSSPPTMDEDSS